MTEPSKAAVEKAMSLCNRDNAQPLTAEAWRRYTSFNELARFIDHVSEVRNRINTMWQDGTPSRANVLAELDALLPDPEPDVLYDALFAVVEMGRYDTREQTELLRGELKSRGYEIRKVQP